MPPLRSHAKSRKGCDQCRTRKVKCDEGGPPCSNCTARELSCTYQKVAAAWASQRENAPFLPVKGTPTQNGIHKDDVAVAFQVFELTILELMHKFSTDTYRSLCVSDSELEIWQMTVPNLALKHDYLMNGLLALASMHIASSLKPPEAFAYFDMGLQRYNWSLRPFRDAIDNLTSQNCDAVFAHSIIMTAIGIASPQLTVIKDESSSIIENMIVVFELLQGAKKIMQVGVGQSWINLELFSRGEFWKNSSADLGADLDADTDAALIRLSALNDEVMMGTYSSQYQVNHEIISHLRHCYAKFSLSPDPAPVLAWLADVKKEFVDGLRCRQPFSLLVLMYWGVLLGELDGRRWWARDAGRALVWELQWTLLGNPRWEHALTWAQQRMSL